MENSDPSSEHKPVNGTKRHLVLAVAASWFLPALLMSLLLSLLLGGLLSSGMVPFIFLFTLAGPFVPESWFVSSVWPFATAGVAALPLASVLVYRMTRPEKPHGKIGLIISTAILSLVWHFWGTVGLFATITAMI